MAFAKDLRASVLQAAMQGKLTEQLETDTPVELLQNIENEPFDIPDSWKWVSVKSFCSIKTGKKDANYGTEDGIYPFFTCAAKPIKCPGYSFDTSAILLAGNGDLNNISIYRGKFEAYQRTYIVEPNENVYLEFLRYAFLSRWVRYNQGKVLGSAIPYIRLKNVQDYEVPIPPIEEQKRIVRRIEEIMTLIDELEAIEEELRKLKAAFPGDMKNAILQAAMQGKLTEQLETDSSVDELLKNIKTEREKLVKEGKIKKSKTPQNDNFVALEDAPFDIPSNWKWDFIPNVTFFQEGPGILAKDFRTQGVPLIRIAGMQDNIVSLDGCNYLDETMVKEKWNHFKLELSDIVISTSASLDKIAVVDNKTVGAIPYTGLIRFQMSSVLLDKYFIYFIQSPCYIKQIDNQKAGGTIKHYGPSHLQKMVIPLPPLEEQQRIVDKLEIILPLIENI